MNKLCALFLVAVHFFYYFQGFVSVILCSIFILVFFLQHQMLAICGKNTARQLQEHFCGLWMPQCIFFLYDFVFIFIRIFHNKMSERQQATICYCCHCRSHLIVTYDCLSGTIYSFVCRHSFQAVGSNIFRYIYFCMVFGIYLFYFLFFYCSLFYCTFASEE